MHLPDIEHVPNSCNWLVNKLVYKAWQILELCFEKTTSLIFTLSEKLRMKGKKKEKTKEATEWRNVRKFKKLNSFRLFSLWLTATSLKRPKMSWNHLETLAPFYPVDQL